MSGRLGKQIAIRVPADLLDALAKDADDNGRTIAQTARFHLYRALPPAPIPTKETE